MPGAWRALRCSRTAVGAIVEIRGGRDPTRAKPRKGGGEMEMALFYLELVCIGRLLLWLSKKALAAG